METKNNSLVLPVAILIAGAIIGFGIVYLPSVSTRVVSEKVQIQKSGLGEKVVPSLGVQLPATWGDLGSKLVSTGAIDAEKFKAIYEQRGDLTDEYETLLLGKSNGKLKITNENAGYLLNLFWALGLASKNPILESGEMTNPAYGGAGNFASK